MRWLSAWRDVDSRQPHLGLIVRPRGANLYVGRRLYRVTINTDRQAARVYKAVKRRGVDLKPWQRHLVEQVLNRRPCDLSHYEHRGPIDLLGDSMAIGTCRTCGTTTGAFDFATWT